MKIEMAQNGDILTVTPEGRLDSTTVPELEEKLGRCLTEDIITLVIDMGRVDFVSSKGIRTLLSLHKKMSSKDGMVLCRINSSVREVLKLAGLMKILNIEDNM